MKEKNLKLMVIGLCFLLATLIFPKMTLAANAPTIPTGLRATAESSSEIYLSWDASTYATSYYIYRSASSSSSYSKIATTTATHYTNTGLSADTTYYYKVMAVNSTDTSFFSAAAYDTTDEADTPDTPTNLEASAESSSEIYLNWDSVNNATSYYIYRSTSSSGTYSKIATTTATHYTDSDLSADTTYYYQVKAVNGSEASSFSTKAYDTTDESDESLSVPTDLEASAESSSEIYLSWDSVRDATSYYVYRATSSSGTYSKIATTTSTHYTDTDLSEDTTYYYKVKAVNGSETSSFSSKAYDTTDESDGSLSAPSDLEATAESSSEIYLSWDSVSDATSYYIYRATSSSGDYDKIATTTSTHYTDTDLSEDTTYYYKVKAVNRSDTSSFSSKAYDTTDESDGSLSAPSDLKATSESSSEIYLRWDSVSDATSYYVYRATSSSDDYDKIATTTSSHYTDKDLSEDTTYYYKVKAVNRSDTSSFSSKAYDTTDESDDNLSAPSDLNATAESSSEIYLSWDSVSDATSYYVYRATSSSGSYDKIATTTSTHYTDTDLAADTTYYYKVKAANSSDTSDYSSNTYVTSAKSDNSNSSPTQFERLAGEDMYGTCAEVAKSWNTSYYAIIVSGENFSDALCSAPLAQKYNAPLLLTKKDTLNEETKAQLIRMKVKNAIIIGGTGVISSEAEQEVKNLGIEVSRIAGKDSYETSIKVAQSMGQFDQAVVASSVIFPDALSIAPIAAMRGIPILLTPKDNLPGNIKEFLAKTVQSTYVVGGTGVISDNVLNQLPSPKRLSGIDRYETNICIIKEFANELNFEKCYFSTGENFADALTGSALASLSNSPVFLVSDPVAQTTKDFVRSKINSIDQEVVFGGEVVVPDSIIDSINEPSDEYDVPSAPTNLKATTAGSSQINLTWDSVEGATSYDVYGSISSSGTYTQIATVTTTGYINTGLWADTTYYYKVRAVNSAGSSSYSSVDYAKTSRPEEE